METRRPLVAGNWKMNGDRAGTRILAVALRSGWKGCEGVEAAVLPPFVYLAEVARLLEGSPIAWGAQNLCPHPDGAHTGEVSAAMLVDYNCRLVVVGHSERRRDCSEDDALVAAKCAVAQRAGLHPIICLGEDRGQREAGQARDTVLRQLEAVLEHCGSGIFPAAVLAYEPVWAIGSGAAADPEQAQEMHALLRGRLAVCGLPCARDTRIIYGGSVNAENAPALCAMPDVDGALVGGASLRAREFLAICRAAARPLG